MFIIEALLSLLAPHLCVVCEREGTVLCNDCTRNIADRSSLSRHMISIGANKTCDVLCITSYTDAAKMLVHDLKFGRKRAVAQAIACWMHQKLPVPYLPGFNPSEDRVIISPIPTSNSRVRQRGYDQAELIGSAYARLCCLPYQTLLRRRTSTRQVGSGRLMRFSQAKHALQVARNIQDQQVIVVDDVMTTGATIEAAASALYAAGAQKVGAIVFARAK